MAKLILRFNVPESIGRLEFADLPQSRELSEALERLQVERLGDLREVSLPELSRVSKAANAVTLELGCLIRRAKCGEFGNRSVEAFCKHDLEKLWRSWPGEVPGETIVIPEAATGFPLAVFKMPSRLRNILHFLGFKCAGELRGREYRHFLRMPGIGVRTLQDLRNLVRQIQEGPGDAPPPLIEKKRRVSPCFVVPEAVRGVVPYGLPISARLDGVLRRMGIARLGDLHGMELSEMHMMSGCGPKTLQEAWQLIEQALARFGSQPD